MASLKSRNVDGLVRDEFLSSLGGGLIKSTKKLRESPVPPCDASSFVFYLSLVYIFYLVEFAEFLAVESLGG